MSPSRANTPTRQPYGYGRLSAPDLREGAEPVELKLLKRKGVILGLAKEAGLEIPEKNIFLECESGATIAKRDFFQTILQHARNGLISVLFTPQIDRLGRGNKRDEADMEEAFKIGKVLIVASDGVLDFGDPDFDVKQGLEYDIRSAVARHYLHQASNRRRVTNRVRTSQALRSGGRPAYGYIYFKAEYANNKLVKPARYETDPETYPVVEEVFRRIWTEGTRGIARDFNVRLRATGSPRLKDKRSQAWTHGMILRMLKNPFYAGFYTHRATKLHGKKYNLPFNEWGWSEVEGDWTKPIDRQQWTAIQQLLEHRDKHGRNGSRIAAPNTQSRSQLTGVLICPVGKPMHFKGHCYTCECHTQNPDAHKGKNISVSKIENVVLDVLTQLISELPSDLWHTRGQKDRINKEEIRARLNVALKGLTEQKELQKDLILYAAMHIRLHGEAVYESLCLERKKLIESLQKEVDSLSYEMKKPDLSAVAPVLQRIEKAGFDEVWRHAPDNLKSQLIGSFFAKISYVEPSQRFINQVLLRLHDWLGDYFPLDWDIPVKSHLGGHQSGKNPNRSRVQASDAWDREA